MCHNESSWDVLGCPAWVCCEFYRLTAHLFLYIWVSSCSSCCTAGQAKPWLDTHTRRNEFYYIQMSNLTSGIQQVSTNAPYLLSCFWIMVIRSSSSAYLSGLLHASFDSFQVQVASYAHAVLSDAYIHTS